MASDNSQKLGNTTMKVGEEKQAIFFCFPTSLREENKEKKENSTSLPSGRGIAAVKGLCTQENFIWNIVYFRIMNISNINKKNQYFIAAQRSQQVSQVYVLFIEIFHAMHVPLSLQMNK